MSTGTGVNVSKANLYAVLQSATGANVPKAGFYAALSLPESNYVSKAQLYAAMGSLAGLNVSKANLYAALAPPNNGFPETPQAILVTPGIGGQGWCHIGSITVEYKSNANIIMIPVIIDTAQGSYYGYTPGQSLTLPSTGGTTLKLEMKPAPNKFKLMQFIFTWSDPTFQFFIEGMAVNLASWGSKAYKAVNPFGYQGGYGGEE